MIDTICAGNFIHQSPLGTLHLDRQLSEVEVIVLVSEMERRGLSPNDILAATIDDGVIDFILREPLSG